LSIALLDLDHFKLTNDRHGHTLGDRVIAALGDLLRRRCRTEDLRCRWGGEEFLMAFPGQTSEFAELAATRLLNEFRQLEFISDSGETFQTSFTAGVAAVPQDGNSLVSLIRQADSLLYEGKREGRNQVRRNLGREQSQLCGV
jgi:diguanylate cyclase (GGDEF)-like protein